MSRDSIGHSLLPNYGGKLRLSEQELEQIQVFLETVHQTLQIPLVLQESNPEYPIALAENHYGISTEDQKSLIEFIEEKYQLGKSDINLKVLMNGRCDLAHIGLPRSLISQLSLDPKTTAN